MERAFFPSGSMPEQNNNATASKGSILAKSIRFFQQKIEKKIAARPLEISAACTASTLTKKKANKRK